MKKLLLSVLMVTISAGSALAASITNKDAEAQILVVTEDGAKREVVIEAGAGMELCPAGCFVTMPSGDRETLSGSENVEIINGSAVIN